jgi:hypothetical protein
LVATAGRKITALTRPTAAVSAAAYRTILMGFFLSDIAPAALMGLSFRKY